MLLALSRSASVIRSAGMCTMSVDMINEWVIDPGRLPWAMSGRANTSSMSRCSHPAAA